LFAALHQPVRAVSKKRPKPPITMDVKQCDCLKHYLCMAIWPGHWPMSCERDIFTLKLRVNSLPLASKNPFAKVEKSLLQRNPAQMTWHNIGCYDWQFRRIEKMSKISFCCCPELLDSSWFYQISFGWAEWLWAMTQSIY
jgi:hypothetical protein